MSLDKQRILNELGSVVNQLQSADCGCMGKLFNNPGQGRPCGGDGSHMANYGGCRHGCSHGHGYGHNHGNSLNSPCAGEPHTAMNQNSMAMGRCNPPQLYADTYNYLNQNLMQPVVKDVYNDLKNLTPTNTIANNPMAGQMGLPAQDSTGHMTNEISYSGQSNTANPMAGGALGSNQMQSMSNTPGMMGNHMMGSMTGMGAQIVNMMMGDGKSKPSNIERHAQGGPLTGPMVIDAPNSPHGQVGVTPLNQSNDFNQTQMNPATAASYAAQGYSNLQPQDQTQSQVYSNLQSQNQSNQNMYSGESRYANSQVNSMTTSLAQNNPDTKHMGNMISNPAAQQMSAAQRNPHGMHTQGVAKFNEMFPGVMQGLGGDLGFDPMAIAIQMNPANQQKVAMETMQKIMNGTHVNKVHDSGANSAMQPAINGVKAATDSFAQPPSPQGRNISAINQQVISNQEYQVGQPATEIIPGQTQQTYYGISPNQPQAQQQHYTAVTGNSQLLPQDLSRYPQLQQQEMAPQGRQIIDRHYTTISPHMPESIERSDPRDLSFAAPPENPRPQAMIKEPIFPVDTLKSTVSPSLTKTKYFEYNTLGQPVEMLPARMFHTQEPNLPQTLSPQQSPTKKREDLLKYSNVKSTVSKTSLMGNKPIGKVPSRSQLQHIYNQYKGSQSFTQQNIRGPTQGVSHSEGHIAANQGQAHAKPQAPVERVGDVVVNNEPHNAVPQKEEHVIERIGDVPMGKPPTQGEPIKRPPPNSKLRNGLQDIVYTSYPSSAAWSFHGNNSPYQPGRRYRHRT